MPAPISDEQNRRDREALLDTAEGLFYAHGIRAVGMDAVRAGSGLPLKRIYRFFPAKEDLVVETLRRRDRRWRGDLAEYVGRVSDPRGRVSAMFDWLSEWFARPGFRGCAWINAFGEMGTASEAVLAEVRGHKEAFRSQVEEWVRDAGGGREEAEAVFLLAEGAIVTAGISGDPGPARRARAVAERLLEQC